MGAGAIIMISILLSTGASVLAVRALLEAGLLQVKPVAAVEPVANESRVPDVVGMPADASDELLSARKLRMIVQDRKPHDRIAAGSVISQAPLAQSRVQLGAEVAVVLSTGPAQKQVPPVVGLTLEDAKHALEQAGLAVGPVSDSDQGEPGTVAAAVPTPGTDVAPGSVVALSVAQAKIEVPKLIGMHVSKARAAIEKAKLKVGSISEIYDRNRKGYLVLSQQPDAGTKVGLGSEINLVVNQGD
jgi:serine/threonine-protein kinase